MKLYLVAMFNAEILLIDDKRVGTQRSQRTNHLSVSFHIRFNNAKEQRFDEGVNLVLPRFLLCSWRMTRGSACD